MKYLIDKIENSYISCACNRTPHAVDWGCNGLICYSACNSIAIYDPQAGGGGKVTVTLAGHQGRVNALKWIKKDCMSAETELVSVSSDQYGLVWSKSDDTYIVSSVLKGHEGSVTVVDAVYTSSSLHPTLTIATASVDSTIRIWKRQHEEGVICKHIVQLDSDICLSLRLVVFGTAPWMLACALDDCHIHLYSESEEAIIKLQVLKGHDDWVTSLDFTEDERDLLLASGSQDSTVRLWRFHTPRTAVSEQSFHVEEKLLLLGSQKLAVSLESVLLGHDGRVYSVQWSPKTNANVSDNLIQGIKLLTASLDKTVVVWSPEAQTGVWLEEVRMGEVGGNTLGFYGACFSPSGGAILAHSYLGGFHLWQKQQEVWKPGVVVGGHYDAVTDLAWEPRHGRFVLSVSSDQTTRLHAPWSLHNNEKSNSWHEIARPQIHGYDLVCLAMLPGFRFVSGADEKVIRVFTGPKNFLENFKRLCLNTEDDKEENLVLPTGAAVPVLGLSNKAVFQNEIDIQPQEKHVKDQYDDNSYFTPQCLQEPPTEDNLLQNTLWPETSKLYGHGYEIFSLASTWDGKLLASACKATSEEHATILIWDTSSWQKIDRLTSHQLTVTQMAFSPNDQFLLSVSRDRRWSLFQKEKSGIGKYKLFARTEKSTGIHTRIIWCCAWSHDSTHFATGSRDGKVVVWGKEAKDPVMGQFGSSSECLDLPKESITSIAFAMEFVLSVDEYLIAIGSEVGDIRLYGWSKHNQSPWRFLSQLSGNSAHHLAVKRLAFRPVSGKTGTKPHSLKNNDTVNKIVQLASCGLDHILKIFDIHIHCDK